MTALAALACLGGARMAWAQAEANTSPAAPTAAPTAAPALATEPANALDEGLVPQLRQLVGQAADALLPSAGQALRVQVVPGQLDPRLRLAPCQKIEPYLPPGQRPLGQTRVGLRCRQGPVHWNVYLPVTVQLWGKGLVAATPLPAGTVLEARHLREAEVDLAAGTDPVLQRPEAALGRTLALPLAAGAALRTADLKLRRWFEPGDTVRLTARGQGFAISGEGQALGPGLEGQPVKVRLEGGRLVSGTASGAHQVELGL